MHGVSTDGWTPLHGLLRQIGDHHASEDDPAGGGPGCRAGIRIQVMDTLTGLDGKYDKGIMLLAHKLSDLRARSTFTGVMVPPSGPLLILERTHDDALSRGVTLVEFGAIHPDIAQSVILAHPDGDQAPNGATTNHRAIGMAASLGVDFPKLSGPFIFLLANPNPLPTRMMSLADIGELEAEPASHQVVDDCIEAGWGVVHFPTFDQWINCPSWHTWKLES